MSTILAKPLESEGKTEWTPEELLAMPDGEHYELVDGLLVERAISLLASRVEVTLGRILDGYCVENGLVPLQALLLG
jgi:hypothetical protein